MSDGQARSAAQQELRNYFDRLLGKARGINASDIHIRGGQAPYLRESKGIVQLDAPELSDDHVRNIIEILLPAKGWQRFVDIGDGDGAYQGQTEDLGRIRVNAFTERGRPALVCRLIPLTVPSVDDLSLPQHLKKLAHFPDGLVLVTGPTGSGKSTTLASVLREANESLPVHMLTLEDPIEYVHPNLRAVVSQREVGADTESFATAMRGMLRQDPDIVVIGEARDRETLATALQAAETGHLVFTTLHTVNVKETLARVFEMFPHEQEMQIRHMLSGVIRAIVCQRMLPAADGGRVVAQEILYASERIKDGISDPEKTGAIPDIIEESKSHYGMQSFNQCYVDLVMEGRITVETAMKASNRPQDLRLQLQQAKGSTNLDSDGPDRDEPTSRVTLT